MTKVKIRCVMCDPKCVIVRQNRLLLVNLSFEVLSCTRFMKCHLKTIMGGAHPKTHKTSRYTKIGKLGLFFGFSCFFLGFLVFFWVFFVFFGFFCFLGF